MQGEARTSYRRDVQGLRAVAVLLVVSAHVLGVPRGGYVGVDVFFVVSGFLITGLLVDEHARTGRIDLREFYARRARRLLPAAALVLAVTNLLAWLVLSGERARQVLSDGLWAGAFLANARFAALGTDYFDETRPPSPVQHFWSLAVEEQFYLVWPCVLLVLLTSLRRRLGVLVVVAAVTAASFAWSVAATATDATAAYFSTPVRAWELGAGALLALAVRAGLPRPGRRAGTALAWAGLTGITAAALLLDERTPFPGSAAALPVAGTLLVLVGASAHPLLVHPVATRLGGLSYSLYLWHWPVGVIAAALLGPGPVRTVTVLVLSFALALASSALVEEPVRRSRWLSRRPRAGTRRPARPAVAVLAGAALLVGGWVAPALALRTSDEPLRPVGPPAAAPLAEVAGSSGALQAAIASSVAPASWPPLDLPLETISSAGSPEWLVDRCDNVNSGNLSRCRYGDPAAPRTAAVVGDSMATSWLPALRALLEPRGWSLQVLTRNQCPLPRIGLWRDRPSEPFTACREHQRWAAAEVRRLRPDLVLASNSLTFLDHQQGEPRGAARFTSWSAGMQAALEDLGSSGARVLLLGPPPRAGNLQACVTRLSTPADCTEAVTDDWTGLRDAERAAAARAGAEYVDVEALFCSAGRCPAVVSSTPVYTDGRHLTAAYARRVAPQLGELLRLAGAPTG